MQKLSPAWAGRLLRPPCDFQAEDGKVLLSGSRRSLHICQLL